MTDVSELITEHLDIWTSAIEKKSGAGRGNGGGISLYGFKKLRELILELALQGKLVAQASNDQPAHDTVEQAMCSLRAKVANGERKAPKSWPENLPVDQDPNLPTGWIAMELDQVGDWAIGSGFPKSEQGQTVGEVLFAKVSDMNRPGNEREIISTANLISYDTAKRIRAHVHPPGTIIFPKIGGAISTNKRRKILFPTAIDNNCLGITPFEFVDDEYLFVFLSAIDLSLYQSGTSVPALSQSTIGKIPFWVPPITEQRRIVAKVDELMGLCDTLEAQAEDSLKAHQTLVETCLAALTNSQTPEDLTQNWPRLEANFDALFTTDESIKSLREAILEWAVRGLLSKTFEADTDPSEFLQNNLAARSELQKETGDARLKKCANTLFEEYRAPLPAGWSAASFDELFLFIDYRGRTPKKTEGGTPLITAKNVRMGQLNREPREYVSDSTYVEWMTRGFPRIGDLFFTTEAPLANVCINDIDEPFALAQRVICLQPISQINTRYLEIAIRSKPVQEMIDRNGTGMTAKGIKASKLKPLAIPFPPIEEQDRIVGKVQQLDAICESLASSLKQVEDTKLNLADGLVRRTSEIAA